MLWVSISLSDIFFLSSQSCELILDFSSESLARSYDLFNDASVTLVLLESHVPRSFGPFWLDSLVYLVLQSTNLIIHVFFWGFKNLHELILVAKQVELFHECFILIIILTLFFDLIQEFSLLLLSDLLEVLVEVHSFLLAELNEVICFLFHVLNIVLNLAFKLINSLS